MHATSFSSFPCLFLLLFFCSFLCSDSCKFTITNNCPITIRPGTLAGSGMPQLLMMGFVLERGQSGRIPSVPGWSGGIRPRTGCIYETGEGTCLTGGCVGKLECAGIGEAPPSLFFEITLGKGTDKDFYNVRVMDGYNLLLIVAVQAFYSCLKELQVVGGNGEDGSEGVITCRSACEAFGLDRYCCGGEFANPPTYCPSCYSTIFKRACPRAYSHAFDDGTSTFT